MNWKRRSCWAVALVASLVNDVATAYTPPLPPYVAEILIKKMKADLTEEAYRQIAAERFHYYDLDGDGRWTIADSEVSKSYRLSTIRANSLVLLMAADLNGDGVLTADEIRRKIILQKHFEQKPVGTSVLDQAVAEFTSIDTDGDGRATYPELSVWLDALIDKEEKLAIRSRPPSNPVYGMWSQIPAFDSNGDGVVTLAEFQAVYAALFRSVDTNQDGVVSVQEAAAYVIGLK